MRREFQIKVAGTVDVSLLVSLGAEFLGQTIQKDIYMGAPDGRVWRIREEGGQYVFARKGHDVGDRARSKEISEEIIDKAKAAYVIKEHGVHAIVYKNRALYRIRSIVIALDSVERMGDFVEIRGDSENELFGVFKNLGLLEKNIVKESYLQMALAKNSPWLFSILRFHEKVGELTFGITSGILTTVGVLVGVNVATTSVLSVVAAIVAIAVADSLSDAFGIYLSKMSERGLGRSTAFRYALGTLAGKFFFPLTFIIPLLCFSPTFAVWLDLGWGLFALVLLSVEQAFVAEVSILKTVGRNVGLAILIVVFSGLVGLFIGGII